MMQKCCVTATVKLGSLCIGQFQIVLKMQLMSELVRLNTACLNPFDKWFVGVTRRIRRNHKNLTLGGLSEIWTRPDD